MSPPDWSDAGYEPSVERDPTVTFAASESESLATDRFMVVIEQLMFIEPC